MPALRIISPRVVAFIACAGLAAAALTMRPGTAAVVTAPQPTISGFRSAAFGSDEAAVRGAITRDFGVPNSAIHPTIDPDNQTEIIAITIPRLVMGLGRANIDYVFGYKSHQLTDVFAAWSTQADPANSAAAMVRAGNDLRDYFRREGFPDPGMKLVNGGQLFLFRAIDPAGHVVLLSMHGTTSMPNPQNHAVFSPNTLIIRYMKDPTHPDIFTVPKGAF